MHFAYQKCAWVIKSASKNVGEEVLNFNNFKNMCFILHFINACLFFNVVWSLRKPNNATDARTFWNSKRELHIELMQTKSSLNFKEGG